MTVNGSVAGLGDKADPETDSIKVGDKRIRAQQKVYLAVNKPKNCLSTVTDPFGRLTIVDLVNARERLVPAGRLDYQSEGLIILTNDGELVRNLTRAGNCAKTYLVKIRGRLAEKDRQKLEGGIILEGKKLSPCEILLHKEADNCWYRVILFEGVNRQIRRMFGRYGYLVSKIKRIAVGPVQLGNLKPGAWRALNENEVASLKKLHRKKAPGIS